MHGYISYLTLTHVEGGGGEREKKGLSHFRFHQAPNGGLDSIEGGRTLAG